MSSLKKLLITDLAQNKLGEISVSETGEVNLVVLEERYSLALEQFVNKISNEPVYLRGGEANKIGAVTMRKQVFPGDEDFLLGVQELLSKINFSGVRVRGFVADNPSKPKEG